MSTRRAPAPLADLLDPGWAEALTPVEERIHRMGDFLRAEDAADHAHATRLAALVSGEIDFVLDPAPRDVARLREVQRLSQEEGVSLAAIQRIFDLEHQVEALRERVAELDDELDAAHEQLGQGRRFFAVGSQGDIVALRHGQRPRQQTGGQALVVWQPYGRA